MKMRYCIVLVVFFIVSFDNTKSYAQSVRLDNLKDQFGKGKAFKFRGALSANSIFYNGNGSYGRDPFSYFVNGSFVLNLYGLINLPFAFTLSNLGNNYSYPIPPNRFSIHPSYKSVTAHIGYISATYSPYTVNGYLFAGAGVDVMPPNGRIKVSTIYGRLQKAIEFDSTNRIALAAYERMGFASKVDYQASSYRLGLILFHAWDDVNSLRTKPDSLNIFPMANTVVSFNGGVSLLKHLNLTVDYAMSALTEDVRAEDAETSNLVGRIAGNTQSTGYANAMKYLLQYTFTKTVIGVGYERIDPGYRTLGVYYMNNDLENFTVNAAQPMFHGKVQLSMNAGYQRDNLRNTKSGSSGRLIGSANIVYNPSPKISSTLTYSNFQTFMRIRPQFWTVNQVDNFQNLDTLNYTQVSQNISSSINWMLSQTDDEMKSMNVDLSFQETADEQGGVIQNGNLSQFYNMSVMYTTSRMTTGRNFSGGVNASYNTIGRDAFLTLGPIASLSATVWQKRITTGATLSYNASKVAAAWDDHVLNVRCHALYRVKKKHTFNVNFLNQWRHTSDRSTNDITVTLGYNFIFG